MWQSHFEFLLLGYGAYATFADLLQGATCRTSPTSTSRRWSRASTCCCSSPTPSCAASRGSPSTPASTAPSPRAARRTRSRRSCRSRDAGKRWLDELEAGQGPVVQHGHGRRPLPLLPQLARRPEHPVRVADRPHQRAQGRRADRASHRGDRSASATGWPSEYGALLDDDARKRRSTSCSALSRTVFPYVEEHKFFCDYWFLTRWWNKLREFGALLARNGFLEDGEDIFQLGRHEVASALDELVLTLGHRRRAARPAHWPPIVARRKELLAQARRLDAAARAGRRARGGHRPDDDHALGRHHRSACRSGRARRTDGHRADRRRRVAGHGRGARARGQDASTRSRDVREGEILVCSITSPAWAPIFSKIKATVTDIGGVMSHAAIVCREYGLPAVVGTGRATSQIRTGQTIRVDGTARRRDDRRRRVGLRPAGAQLTRPLAELRRADDAAVRRQERDARRADRRRDPGAAGLRALHRGVPRVRGGGRARGHDRERDARAPRPATSTRSTPPRTRSARRCASRPVPDAVRDEVTRLLRRSSRSAASPRRPWRCARARSARTARTPPSPASRRRTCGCAAPSASATRCATAG